MVEKNRTYYEWLFADYADVVDLQTLRRMLGGISESFTRDKLRKGIIRSFLMERKVYMIPKIYVIDYILSDDYQNTKHLLKAQI